MIKISGAGIAGLTAAINLSEGGEKVQVYEARKGVGLRFHQNLQGLKVSGEGTDEYFRRMGVKSGIGCRNFSRMVFSTRKRDMTLNLSKPLPFVVRGGKDSLEYALYKEALSSGVEFTFNQKLPEPEANIVATGYKRCDMAAVGFVFEDTDFPRDQFFIMFDDRYSPKGWYSYILPVSATEIEFVNCVCQPHVPLLRKLTEKVMVERKILHDFLEGKKRIAEFGGVGGVDFPATAFREGRYYVGEAGGFQDPFMGFGINYAIETGKLAADAILQKGDYDKMWKERLMPRIKKEFARKFMMSVFGDALPEMLFRKFRDGDTIDFNKAIPGKGSFVHRMLEGHLVGMEILKRKVTGYW